MDFGQEICVAGLGGGVQMWSSGKKRPLNKTRDKALSGPGAAAYCGD